VKTTSTLLSRIATALFVGCTTILALSFCEPVPSVSPSAISIETVRRESSSIHVRGTGRLVPENDRSTTAPRGPVRTGRRDTPRERNAGPSRRLEASMRLSKEEAAQLSIGDQAEVDLQGVTVVGRIVRVDPDERNGGATIAVRLPGDLPRSARPNRPIGISINVERLHSSLVVARPAHAGGRGKLVLFRLLPDGRAAERVVVRTGRVRLDTIQVTAGLEAGDRVIVSDLSAFEGHERILIRD
jgi:hypothetical protein